MHICNRETYPRQGKISPGSVHFGSVKRRPGEGRGHRSHALSAVSRPRPLLDFPFLALCPPSTDCRLRHRLFPSNEVGSLPSSPPCFPPTNQAPPPAKRKSPSAAVRRWSKSVHTESSSRVEASSGQLAGDPSIRRSTAHLSNVSRHAS